MLLDLQNIKYFLHDKYKATADVLVNDIRIGQLSIINLELDSEEDYSIVPFQNKIYLWNNYVAYKKSISDDSWALPQDIKGVLNLYEMLPTSL